jgi:hypothetical protein
MWEKKIIFQAKGKFSSAFSLWWERKIFYIYRFFPHKHNRINFIIYFDYARKILLPLHSFMFWRKIFGSPFCVGEPSKAWKSHFGDCARLPEKFESLCCVWKRARDCTHREKIFFQRNLEGKFFSLSVEWKSFLFWLQCVRRRENFFESLRVYECFVWGQQWNILEQWRDDWMWRRWLYESLSVLVDVYEKSTTLRSMELSTNTSSKIFMSICEVLRFVLVFSLASRKFFMKILLRFMLKMRCNDYVKNFNGLSELIKYN